MPAAQAVRASSVRRAARFAYAAGITAMLANLFLIAFYALQASHPEDGTSLGSANDLIGSLATAFMIPVALALTAWLPDRRSARITHVIGLSAMAVLTVDGPLLVLGVLTFGVQAPIMVAAWMILCLWLFLVNRWLRLSDALSPRVARFGEFVGVGTLAGGAVVGLGLLLPWMSWGQWILFGAGGLLGTVGWLGIPVWFLLLGRDLAKDGTRR
jgi:MFS family permease